MPVDALTSASAASQATTKKDGAALKTLSDNYNTFLKLLTTQLQYQDPTNPTDSSTFTQQLVQYSQVEQQIKTNDQLTSLVDVTKGNSNSNAALLNYLGKYVEVTGKELVLQKGAATGTYQLANAANSVTLDIQDSSGKTVASFNGPTGAGLQKVAWDGKDASGKTLPDGTYTLQVKASDAKGSAILVKTQSLIGLVTGVERTDTGNVLSVGKRQVADKDILNVLNSVADKAA
jgi:flagellar basal-body rod modification protein FlgD